VSLWMHPLLLFCTTQELTCSRDACITGVSLQKGWACLHAADAGMFVLVGASVCCREMSVARCYIEHQKRS
jgi:hypothetical protein